jgi:two-component system, chemotaxis family, CheB/CheR fusion protein
MTVKKPPDSQPPAAGDLHGEAEKRLRISKKGRIPDLSDRALLHELQVHQIELEMQQDELEASKEELQSINEKLNAVNRRLNEKIGELTGANNDLINLANATEIATIFLDGELRIKQFTPRATDLLNLAPSDAGRPLSHITQRFDGKSISAIAGDVMRGLSPVEKEVRIPDGRWYTMRVLPYRTLDNRIDGAVVIFTDVSRLKRLEDSLQRAKDYAESIVATVRAPLLVLDSALRVVSANSSFYQLFQVSQNTTIGEFIYALGDGQWNGPELRKLLEKIITAHSEFKDFRVEHDFPGLGPRIMLLNAKRMEPAEESTNLILLAIEDVTKREQARRQIESFAAELEKRVQARTAELRQAKEQLKTLNEGLALRASQLHALTIELTLAEQNERKRLAQILHDDLQQLLVASKLHVGLIRYENKADNAFNKSLGELEHILQEAIQLGRSLSVQLSPPLLTEVGLAAAVRWLGDEMKRLHGLEVSVDDDGEIRQEAGGVVLLLFHAVRELLFNVTKHAGVKSAAVRIIRPSDNHVQIEVVDKGSGFDLGELNRKKSTGTGLGLLGLQTRITNIGGHIEVESTPGEGTRIVVSAELGLQVSGSLQEKPAGDLAAVR